MVKRYLVKVIFITLLIIPIGYIEGDNTTYLELGEKEEYKGNFGLAIDYYNKAINGKEKNAYIYSKIGKIYEDKLDNDKKALDIYERGIEQFPKDFELNLYAMYLLFKFDRDHEGLMKYTLLSKIRNKQDIYMFPRHFLAKIRDEMDDVEFLSFCKKYLEVNSTDSILRRYLASIYFNNGDALNAANEYEILLKENRELESIYFNLGVCYFKLNKYELALEYLNKAKEYDYLPASYIQKKIDEINKMINVK